MVLNLIFGTMAPPIGAQLAGQGVKPKKTSLLFHWQRDAVAITRLSVRGLLTESQVKQARQRLLRNILHSVEKAGRKGDGG